MSLKESVRQWVLKNLPYDENDPKIAAVMHAKGPRDLLVLYLNWRERLIPPVPRRVFRSPRFEADAIAIVRQRAAAIEQIVSDIEQGCDLTKYLSRQVKIGYDLPTQRAAKNLNKQRHLDLLLNDWGIHHLHVATILEADGFVERTNSLIFAIFRPERAYLIGFGDHCDFAREQLIHSTIESWPDEGLMFELKGIRGPRSGQLYTEKRAKLRAAGLSIPFVQLDGRVFAPPNGISTAGTSDKASIYSGRIMRALTLFEEQIRTDPTSIIEVLRRQAKCLPDTPKFEFSFFRDGYGVVETTSGVAIGLRL